MTCKARQYSDQMVCTTCNLAWDINDQDPPMCVGLAPDPVTDTERLDFIAAQAVEFVMRKGKTIIWYGTRANSRESIVGKDLRGALDVAIIRERSR